MALPLTVDAGNRPHVMLVVGVNGTGKTTTVGKLAKRLQGEGRRVMMAAGDTFRAAGVSQLERWGERVGCPVVSRATGADAAGLVFDALDRARREDADVLLVDTAGRLQNRGDLMAELQKIIRVMKKLDSSAPHSCLLVLDATTGQNTHAQVGVFQEMTDVTGLIVTKLDGTAKGLGFWWRWPSVSACRFTPSASASRRTIGRAGRPVPRATLRSSRHRGLRRAPDGAWRSSYSRSPSSPGGLVRTLGDAQARLEGGDPVVGAFHEPANASMGGGKRHIRGVGRLLRRNHIHGAVAARLRARASSGRPALSR